MSTLAPVPDFRYVDLVPAGSRSRAPAWLAAALGGAGSLVTLAKLSGGYMLLAAGAVSGALAFLPGALAPRDRVALVPWGVLVENESSLRALSWASVSEVDWSPIGTRTDGMSTITHSEIRIVTRDGAFEGRSRGEAPLGGLGANLAAYTAEQSHVLALDLHDETRFTVPGGPICEPVLRAARSLLETAELRAYLGLQGVDYRGHHRERVGPDGIGRLRAILRDRTARVPDRRGLVCALVGELRLTELLEEMYWLIACPHPAIAALAKHAARHAGGSLARAGSLGEVAPFLHGEDVDFLSDAPPRSL